MAELGCILEHNPGKGNIVADTSSIKFELSSITMTNCEIPDITKDGM